MQVCTAASHIAAARCTERNQRNAVKIITLKECINNFRRLSPTDGIADIDNVVLSDIINASADCGAGRRILLLLVGSAIAIAII